MVCLHVNASGMDGMLFFLMQKSIFMSIYDILAKFRQETVTERQKGDVFEKLMQRWLLSDPSYSNLFTKVWMWKDSPCTESLGKQDLGIDLVALDDNGGYWAIQCKCYDDKTVIQKAAVDSFLANSSRQFNIDNQTYSFAGRLWISTTNKFGKNAEQSLENQNPPVNKVSLNTLNDSQVDWELLLNGKNGTDALRKKATPRDYQLPIIDAALDHFSQNERGTLVMACGTGKTLTSMFIAQQMLKNKGLVLFLAPSIALVAQSLNSWFANSEKPIKAVCVCSDSSAGSIEYNEEEDHMVESLTDLPIRSCTNPKAIIDEIERYKNHDGLLICFSTYQSIDVVKTAQSTLIEKSGGEFGEFDLIICDEAHRTASVKISGKNETDFTKVHNGNYVKAKHRMYMTATPKIYNEASKNKADLNDDLLFSMDKEEYFGKHFYNLDFGTAVDKGLLTDYKVLVLTIDEKNANSEFLNAYKRYVDQHNQETPDKEHIHHITPEQQAMIIGSVSAMSKQLLYANKDDFAEDENIGKPMHTAIAFCDNVRRYKKTKEGVYVAEEISQAFEDVTAVYKKVFEGDEDSKEFLEKLVDVKSTMVSGDMPTNERNENLNILRESFDPYEKRSNIVCNVNCLSEGVDVPALDAAIFLASKKSMITIVQSVGRVMRKFEGKKYGYIIVPVVIPIGADPVKEMDKNERYKLVWNILNAMRSHDERLAAELSNHNYTHVKIVSPRPPRGGNGGTGGGRPTGGGGKTEGPILFPEELEFVDKLYARMVDKVGDRLYWDKWSTKVGDIAQNFIARLNDLVENGKYVKEVDHFVSDLQKNINPSIGREQAITFLAQQLITKPVFDALFPDYQFAKNNTVSKSIQSVLDVIQDEAFVSDRNVLESFYNNVSQVCGTLRTIDEKQDTIKTLYEKFFKKAFPRIVEQLGIIYTPIDCVNFIIKSVDDVLKKEFKVSLKDRGVNILDPFTGTGTFITQTLNYLKNHGITDEDLRYKYLNEIHCNEIVLLSYYIADVNIESVYNDIVSEKGYLPYNNICLTDTFQLTESKQYKFKGEGYYFIENTKQIEQQKKTPIKVIIANPPYSIGQKSADDMAANLHYEDLENRIEQTYAKRSSANLQKSIYDSYIKAFRWASDRIHENGETGGVVAFISNGSWLDGNALDGFRKCIEEEFSDIYVFNLRGNARTSGELRRKEKDSVFGQGTRTTIVITVLVDNPHKSPERYAVWKKLKDAELEFKQCILTDEEKKLMKADIHYLDIGDYLTQQEKLDKIKKIGSVLSKDFGKGRITPNEHGDWISMRNDVFKELIPINPEKNFEEKSKTFFTSQAIGVATNRDTWTYNYSKDALKQGIDKFIAFYDNQRKNYALKSKTNPTLKVEDFIDTDKTQISWTVNMKKYCEKNIELSYSDTDFIEGSYRPFQKMSLCYNQYMIERPGQWGKLFPTPRHNNILICVSGVGASKNFSTHISQNIPDLQLLFNGQCFPLYWYESTEDFNKRTKKKGNPGMKSLFDDDDMYDYKRIGFDEYGYLRHDGISDYILKEFRTRYGLSAKSTDITKEDIFYYVYGLLHSEDYRTTFEADLKKMLPRIPIVESAKEFKAFMEAGRKLAELHLNYEEVEPCPGVTVDETGTKQDEYAYYTVEKMRFPTGMKAKDKPNTILYNGHIVINNIPQVAYDYVVNGKSAIEWIMERYAVTIDKESQIKNDPNDWSREHEKPRYILDLLLSVINVSVQTVAIVKSLPSLNLGVAQSTATQPAIETPAMTEILEDVAEEDKFVQFLPFYNLKAACGAFEANELPTQTGWIDISTSGVHPRGDKNYFICQAKGNSMQPKIEDGDWVICRFYTPDNGGSRNGKMVIAQISEYDGDYDGKYTLKEYHSEKNADGNRKSITLRPLNKAYSPIELHEEDDVKVVAVVEAVMRGI